MNKITVYIFLILFVFIASGQAKAQIAYNNNQPKTLMEDNTSASRPVLKQAIKHAGLTPLLTSEGPYTFLVPSEEAVAALLQVSPQEARMALSAHILEGEVKAENMRDGAKLKNLNGQTLTVCRKKNRILINGIQITESNRQTSNGIYHTLNGLLKPADLIK